MSDLGDKIRQSRDAGFSDADIVRHMGEMPEYQDKIYLSHQMGRSDKEIIDFLMGQAPLTTVDKSVDPLRLGGSFARGAAEGVYDIATLPYQALGDTDKLKESILSGAPKPSGPFEKAAEGAGEAIGATLPQLGIGAKLATAPGKLGKIGRVLSEGPKRQLAIAGGAGALEGATDVPGVGPAAAAAAPLFEALARKVITPNLSHLAGDQLRLLELARTHGIPLTAADITGNKTLHQAEAVLKTLPGSSGVMQEFDQTQREAFNRAVMKVAGLDEKYATPQALEKAHDALGKELDHLAAESSGILDRQFAADVAKAQVDYGRRLNTDVKGAWKSYMDDLEPYLMQARADNVATPISGEKYDEIRKSLAKRIRTTGDPFFKDALEHLVEALDGAMERSSPPGTREQWEETRRRYSALVTIEKAMQGGQQADRETGNIPFGAFKNAVLQSDKSGFARGRGQFNDLARIGDFIAPKVPNSGTPERYNMQKLLKGSFIPGAIGYGLGTGDVVTPALAVGTPYAASKLYTTDAITRWLTRNGPKQSFRDLALDVLRGTAPQGARVIADE